MSIVTTKIKGLLESYPRILSDLEKTENQSFDDIGNPDLVELILDGAVAYREKEGKTLYMARLNLDYVPEISALYCDGVLTILKHKTAGLLFCGLPKISSMFESAAYLRMEFVSP